MNSKLLVTLAGSALIIVALAGCSTPAGDSTPAAAAPTESSGAAVDAAVASTTLGQIVVDGKGMTAYVFDKDVANSGKSACVADCALLWPAITSATTHPQVTGVTGTVGTITGINGGMQITINGLPIYQFSKDTAPGDVKGQDFKGIWHVLAPTGVKIAKAAGGY